MEQEGIETVGKVFVVVGGMRRCLICDGMFTPTQAANHAATTGFPTSTDSKHAAGSLFDPVLRSSTEKEGGFIQ